jgi:hypothetical protein
MEWAISHLQESPLKLILPHFMDLCTINEESTLLCCIQKKNNGQKTKSTRHAKLFMHVSFKAAEVCFIKLRTFLP